ncbi:hypothetical protein PMIN01_02646 [Paraphaeosphaeria minitans]|uniref:Uncharacterized protein n=1 Tax=Paraphaeosphaeria minitans TaxID=565426 RepID=A0A9P6GRE2_9PLEO|nr:hypothetical protein PMIN01_02646 [Paraphaeosphaeria minitans]
MELVSWIFGAKPKVPEQVPYTTTPGDKLDGEVKTCSRQVSPEKNTPSRSIHFTVEEFGGGDEMSDDDEDPEDGSLDTETEPSNNAQIRRSNSTKPAASSRSSSTAELFGGDDTDFLDDSRTKVSVSMKFQRPTEGLPENSKDVASTATTEIGTDDGAYNGDIASPPALGPEDAPGQSALPEPDTSGEDDQINFPTNEDQSNAHEDKRNEQQDVATEQKTLAEESIAIVEASSTNAALEYPHKLTFGFNWADSVEEECDVDKEIAMGKERSTKQSSKPVVKTRWADMDDDDDVDYWKSSAEWTSDQTAIHTTYGPTYQTFQETERGSKVGTLSARLPSSRSRTGAGYPILGKGGDAANAGYDGPSRSLDFHQYSNVEQAHRNEELRWDAEEAYQLQIQKLWERYAVDIESLKEPSTISPDEVDLHDEQMCKFFRGIYPALPSQEIPGNMHIIDWKTLAGPDQTGPELDDEENFLLQFVKPRLCDALATILFESDPAALDAWLDPSKKVVEWWHSPHYLHRGVMRTVFRRDGNDVIVGTFTDLGFAWTETYAFQGGQFQKEPGEKEPGASSQKIRGEIDWESFEIGQAKCYDYDELSDPVEALWHGRVLAHTMLRMVLNSYSQYRGGNTVDLAVDGKWTSIEQRGVTRVPRANGIENDRIEEVVSSPGLSAPFEEVIPSLELSSEEMNEVGELGALAR